MSGSIARAAVIGDGGMGTLCALLLARRGTAVTLWGHSPDHVGELRQQRENRRHLPGFSIPDGVTITADPVEALTGADLVVSAVPCQFMRPVWTANARFIRRGTAIVSVTKGLEVGTLRLPTGIIADCVHGSPLACLSGPCIASEAAAGKPTGVVIASSDPLLAETAQAGISNESFRAYTSTDVLGVELAGAVKNVIALAAGIGDGLGVGDNAKAALVTRGLVEITRLGAAMGASPDTFRGLAGVGDLVTTCISKVGRNRTAGERIGRGESPDAVVTSTPSVIEGIPTTRSVLALARHCGVDMPIVSAVAAVLFHGVRPADAIRELMIRQLRNEVPM